MKSVTTKKRGDFVGKQNVMKCNLTICKQKSDLSPKHLRYRGIALVWTAILFMVLVLMAGLAIDIAKLLLNFHQLQNAADAAALAGAQIVKIDHPDDTRLLTHTVGFANKAEHLEVTLRLDTDHTDQKQWDPLTGDENSYDILLGRWVRYNKTFVPTLDAPNAVKTLARRNADLGLTIPALRALNLLFGPMVGTDTADASAIAVGWCYDSSGAGLICLSRVAEPGLYVGGTSKLNIDGGGIHVNAEYFDENANNSSNAADIQGGGQGFPEVDAGFINVVGEIQPLPFDEDWETIFGVGEEGKEGYSVSDVSASLAPEHIVDPLAANMMDIPHLVEVVLNETEDYARLKVPELINNGILPITQTLEGIPIPTNEPIGFSCSLGPGYYPTGLNISNGVDIELKPASDSGLGTIFVFGGTGGIQGGSGLVMTAGSLTGEGVTCYVTQNFSNGDYGEITITGGTLKLWSPGDWTNEKNGVFNVNLVNGLNGIAVWQDPTMVDKHGNHPDVHLNGNGDFFISGTLYFPNPIHAKLEGNLGQAGNQILCGSAELHGDANITVNYDQRNQGESGRCCLVE